MGLPRTEEESYQYEFTSQLNVRAGISHQLDQAHPSGQMPLATQLHELSVAAIHDLDVRFSQPGYQPASQRGGLDSVASFLLKAEHALGKPLSDLSADLKRRERNRKIRRRAGSDRTIFPNRYPEIMKLWDEHRETWFRQRYSMKTGTPAPPDFMIKTAFARSGWKIRDDIRPLFTPQDYRDFRTHMDALYREQQGIPAKGEGWVSQTYLAKCVREVLSNYDVVLEARPEWLTPQRLDIFVPALKLAIEYQGEQHYFPLEHWGGEQGLKDRQMMDKTKRLACQRAGIHLIEWRYTIQISTQSVREILTDHGIPFSSHSQD